MRRTAPHLFSKSTQGWMQPAPFLTAAATTFRPWLWNLQNIASAARSPEAARRMIPSIPGAAASDFRRSGEAGSGHQGETDTPTRDSGTVAPNGTLVLPGGLSPY